MPNSKKPSKAPFGSYLWSKQVEEKHQADFKGWPVGKKTASAKPKKK
mgnify:CR=1 FL=1